MKLCRPRRLPPVRRGRLTALPPAIFLALAPLLVGAQGATAQPRQGGDVVGQSRPPAPALNIDFRGGSIGDYLEAVKKAAEPTPVNVIVSDDVARLKANPVELRGVSVQTALNLLQQGQVLTPEPISMQQAAWDGESAPVYLISSGQMPQHMRARQTPPPPQRSVQVFSIRDLVEPDPGSPGALTIDPETLMSSIDAAMSLHGESEERDVLFHPEAGILIVRAEEAEIGVVASLLAEIQRDMAQRRASAARAANEIQELEHRLMQLEAENRIVEAERDIARRRLARVEHEAEGGLDREGVVESARLDVLRAEAKAQSVGEALQRTYQQLRERKGETPAGDDRQSLLNEITRLKAEVAALRAELGRGEGEDRGGR